MENSSVETDKQSTKTSELDKSVPQPEPSKQKTKQHKEIQIRTLDENKLKELAETIHSNIEVLTFRLENKGIYDVQGIHFSAALRLFASKGAKKLRIYLTNNPVTHNTLEEICKNLKEYLPNLVHLVFQLDQTLVNDQGITYIFEMLREIGEYLKCFEISLTGSQVTEIGMSDLFQALKFLPLECDVFVGNEESESLQSLAKEYSSYKKFQRMLQSGKESESDEEEDEDEESDEDNLIKIRNLEEEGSDDEDNKKKRKKKEKKQKQSKKKKGLLRTTKQNNQFNAFPQITPQFLAGINPMVLQQMYTQMMQQQQRMSGNKMMMNPYMWQQNQLLMQNMMRGMPQQQQQPRIPQQMQQGQKFPMPGFPAQQQFTPQMMQQQTQAFQQLQKNLKQIQKNQATGATSGEQKKTEDEEKEKQESKKEDEGLLKKEAQQSQQQQQPQQQQQQQSTPIDLNVQKSTMQQPTIEMLKLQSQPQQQPKQVGDFQLILEKLRSQQALLQQQQSLQNQKPSQQEQNIQKAPENIAQIGKPVQAIPPGFQQKQQQQQQQQQQQNAVKQPVGQQSLQESIVSYFSNLQPQAQPQQQNQSQAQPKQTKPQEMGQGQQYSQLFNQFEKNQSSDVSAFNNPFQSLNFFQQLKDEKNKQDKQNED